MRLVNNETLDSKDVLEPLKDALEMYIEALDPDNDEDPETLDPEGIYDDLDLGSYSQFSFILSWVSLCWQLNSNEKTQYQCQGFILVFICLFCIQYVHLLVLEEKYPITD
jgi:hypothetical protein